MATKKARVRVAVHQKGWLSAPLAIAETEMSTDLPADNLGEVIADALQLAWKAGHDPVDCQLLVTFG